MTCAAIVAFPVAVFADGVAITHDAVACMIVGKFPELQAKLHPEDQVARARVDFQAEGDTHWYYVDMTPRESVFKGVLPKPLKAAKKVHYYIEAADKALVETRTQDYVSEVVDSAGICADPKKVASAVASASVKVGAAPGAPAVPSGFASEGIAGAAASAGATAATAVGAGAATGGGMSGAAIAGIAVGGAAAVAAGVAVATHKGSQNVMTYTINVNVTGSGPANKFPNDWGGALDVCVSYQGPGGGNPCSNIIAVGSTGQIVVVATPGTTYTVAIPTPITTKYCSVTSGGSGVFGPSLATVVVSCTW
jgi:hypothetical protein